MAYFPNGTAGEMYREAYCDKCRWDRNENCPIWLAHLVHNYEDCNKTDSALHMLIPRSKDRLGNEECFFYMPENGELPL